MIKKVLLTLISIVLLTAFSKSTKVVPFLQSVEKGLPDSTNVPVLLPTYWNEQSKKRKKYTAVKVKAYENGYMIYFLAMDNPYRPNDSALFHPRESSKLGELSGYVGTTRIPSERPSDFVFSKVIDEGDISILGTRREAYTSISWETNDGFIYHFSYKGPIKEAVKIVDSLKYVR